MNLSSVAHAVFPAALRDIGSGLYHIAKRDANDEQYQKLTSATLRVTAAAAVALALLASMWLVDNTVLSLVSGFAIITTSLALDPETCFLASAASTTINGVILLAVGVNLAVHSLYGAGALWGVLGVGFISIGHRFSRLPRDECDLPGTIREPLKTS